MKAARDIPSEQHFKSSKEFLKRVREPVYKLGQRISQVTWGKRRIFYFWFKGRGKSSFSNELCYFCKYRLDPKGCVERIETLRKKSKGDQWFATWPVTTLSRMCTVNKKMGIFAMPYTENWKKILYPEKQLKAKAKDPKVVKAQLAVEKLLLPFRGDRNEDGTFRARYISEKDLFMKGLKLGLLVKSSAGPWNIVPVKGDA